MRLTSNNSPPAWLARLRRARDFRRPRWRSVKAACSSSRSRPSSCRCARGPAPAATVESRSHLRRLRLRAARVRPSSHDRSACVGPAYACSWIDKTSVYYDYTPYTVTRLYPNNHVHTDDRPSRPRARAPTAQTRRRTTTTTTCPRRRRDNRSRRLNSSSSATGGRVRARDDGRRPTTDEMRFERSRGKPR